MITRILLMTALLITQQAYAHNHDMDKNAVEGVVSNYIQQHPEVIMTSLIQYQKSQAQQALNAEKAPLFSNNGALIFGNPKGNKQIVEFIDYQCKYCKLMSPVLKRVLQKDSDVKLIVRPVPLFGSPSSYAAAMALVAQKQGKLATFHQLLLQQTQALTDASIDQLATQAGLNTQAIASAKQPQWNTLVKTNLTFIQRLGLNGTPAFIISTPKSKDLALMPGAITQAQLEKAL